MKLRIPETMAWKYNAKCSKTPSGDDILTWIHPTMPKPSKVQIAIDVQEFLTWEANEIVEKTQAHKDLDNELALPNGNPIKILKALRRLNKI